MHKSRTSSHVLIAIKVLTDLKREEILKADTLAGQFSALLSQAIHLKKLVPEARYKAEGKVAEFVAAVAHLAPRRVRRCRSQTQRLSIWGLR